MTAWRNTPAALSLLAEFNEAFPSRDRASDGTVGDLAHQGSASDHNPDETGNTGGVEDADNLNETHAVDIDKDLRRAGWTMERCVSIILARCRSGAERRLRYIIFRRRIWSASNNWRQEAYRGANPHDKHAHFSLRYGSGGGAGNPENTTSPWGILAAIEQEADMDARQMTEWANSAAGQAALTKAAGAALGKQRALGLKRLADAGWGGKDGMSVDEILAYLLEGVNAATPAGRLARIEADLKTLLGRTDTP